MQTQYNAIQPKTQNAWNKPLYAKIASIPQYFNQHKSKLTPLPNQTHDNMQEQFKELNKKMQKLLDGQTLLTNLQQQVISLESENKTLKQEITTLKTETKPIRLQHKNLH